MAKIAKALLTLATTYAAAGALAEIPTADLLAFHSEHAERFGHKPVKKFPSRAAAEEKTAALAQAIVDASTAPPAEKPAKEPGNASAGVAASWANPDVRAARAARHAVKVGGETYRSVKAAFDALKLDLSKHVAFRGKLAKDGKGEFEGHKFTVVKPA